MLEGIKFTPVKKADGKPSPLAPFCASLCRDARKDGIIHTKRELITKTTQSVEKVSHDYILAALNPQIHFAAKVLSTKKSRLSCFFFGKNLSIAMNRFHSIFVQIYQ